ncbi:hypothetical protein L7F22_054961 [Adiantum nelumboides]|nr:hypothetical protein [Adiantum nelumboides]
MNRTPTAAVHNVTPEEKFSGKKPNVGHLKVFGCIAYVHVADELRTNLDPKVEKCIFIGYSLEQKGYKCYNPITRHVRVSRDVVSDEMASWYADLKHDIGADVMDKVVTENTGYDDGNSSDFEHSLDEEFEIPFVRTPGVKKALQGMHEKLRRSRRHKNPVDRLTYDSYVAHHCAYMAKIVQDKEPTCFDDAIGNIKWEQAMDEEMVALDMKSSSSHSRIKYLFFD